MVGKHFSDRSQDGCDYFARYFREFDLVLCEDVASQVGYREGGLVGMDIESENTSLTVEIEKGGPSTAGNLTGRSFNDPSLPKQLFDDERDCTSL
jgi:hypothetical protein